ncbi:AraC family ligand binding domain-containing protein [Paenibacillus sp. P26]|nr:AraC family ligand binding domain-containing protein [Paenibacillus sp. P26]
MSYCSRAEAGIFRRIGQDEMILNAGSILLLGEGVPHEYFAASKEEGWELGFIGFQGNASSAAAALAGIGQPRMIQEERFSRLWEELIQLWHIVNDNEPDSVWEASVRFYAILLSLQKEQAHEGEQAAHPSRGDRTKRCSMRRASWRSIITRTCSCPMWPVRSVIRCSIFTGSSWALTA